MTIRKLLVGAAAFVLLLGGATATTQAQTAADVALDAIDELAHQWEDGEISAEDALELIEEIIHDVPASQRIGMLLDMDEVVHHWEDGDITAEAAMEEIEGILHGGAHDDGGAGATPAPATTGSAGLIPAGTSATLALGLLVATVFAIGGARVLGSAVRDS